MEKHLLGTASMERVGNKTASDPESISLSMSEFALEVDISMKMSDELLIIGCSVLCYKQGRVIENTTHLIACTSFVVRATRAAGGSEPLCSEFYLLCF